MLTRREALVGGAAVAATAALGAVGVSRDALQLTGSGTYAITGYTVNTFPLVDLYWLDEAKAGDVVLWSACGAPRVRRNGMLHMPGPDYDLFAAGTFHEPAP